MARRRPYAPPGAVEIVELGLQNCRCNGLRRVELLTNLLADHTVAAKVREKAVWGLVHESDPAVSAALQAAAADRKRTVRLSAAAVLRVRETLRTLPPELRERGVRDW